MTHHESNIFPITNLQELSSEYRLYKIKGLRSEQSEYYQNCQILKRKLAFRLRTPVALIERDSIPYLVIRNDSNEPPNPFPLVRVAVSFERCDGVFKLDYGLRSLENDEISLRFLQFMLQTPLFDNPDLWQPRSGQPYFKKEPDSSKGDLAIYSGFSVRAAVMPGGGLGVCVDVAHKIVYRLPLASQITRDQFPKWKNRHCIYHYGHKWYEIQIMNLHDQNVTGYLVPKNGRWIPLLQYIIDESRKPIPLELAQVPEDGSVFLYKTNRDEEHGAPSALCYPVVGTDDIEAKGQHRSSILLPHVRRSEISRFVQHHLRTLSFGNSKVQISTTPVNLAPRIFAVPDIEFGNKKILSVRGTPNAHQVSLDSLGQTRLSLLRDLAAGFYTKGPLDRQYVVLPQTIHDNYGPSFCKDLARTVDELYPQNGGFKPIIVTYNDRVSSTFPQQGNAILKAVREQCDKPGYALVMVHYRTDQRHREEDQLAAMVVREMRKLDIPTTVIHSEMGKDCYELEQNTSNYFVRQDKKGMWSGYLRGVALSKILLNNQRWPFVLATKLNADVTIGIDVKSNTAGLVTVSSNGGEIRPLVRTSRQKERLSSEQIQALIVEILRSEAQASSSKIQTIVFHRDGRVFQPEIIGIRDAMALLKREGTLIPESSATILEIAKSSPVPLRIFDIYSRGGKPLIDNPQIGFYTIIQEKDGYVCNTGRAFPRRGTVRPLHVKHIEGPLALERCLEDIYYLSALTWTRPEDCARYPITIKLNDRFLGEDATEYDSDALEHQSILSEEEEI